MGDVPAAIKMREDEAEIEKQAPGKEVASQELLHLGQGPRGPRVFVEVPRMLVDPAGQDQAGPLRGMPEEVREHPRGLGQSHARAGYEITEHFAKKLEREGEQQKIKRSKMSNKTTRTLRERASTRTSR